MKKRCLRGNEAQAVTEYVLLISIIGISCFGFAKIAKILVVDYFDVFVKVFMIPIP